MSFTASFYTLGCKLNFTETSAISTQLADAGINTIDFTKGADIYVINTCSVTDHADRKCKRVVKEALKYNKEAFIVIVGCYAQLKPKEIAEIEGVDLVLGAAEKFNLVSHLVDITKRNKATIYNANIKEVQNFIPAYSKEERTRTFLKVQDGCDYFCSFCTIPLARGMSRSNSIDQTILKAKEAAYYANEIILTGVNLGDFGINNNETFYELAKAIDSEVEINRLRISSIEPNLLNDKIINLVAESNKFVPHFHIPLQSGNDEILKSMRRKYDTNYYRNLIYRIKETMPDCCIGVDVIAGYPDEDENKFLDTYQFLNQLPISYLHVFPYSERPNTTAYKLKQVVPHHKRTERVNMLRILSEKKRAEFYRSQVNKIRPVLFEQKVEDNFIYGFTDNYVKVKTKYDPLLVDAIANCQLSKIGADGNFEIVELEIVEQHRNIEPINFEA